MAAFINDVLPDRFVSNKQSTSVPAAQRKNYDADKYGKVYVQKEKELLNSGLDPSAAARQAEKFALQAALKIPQTTFKVPSFQDNLVSSRVIRSESVSNFSGKLNLQIDANVNESEFNKFVDFKIKDNNDMQLNLLTN